MLGRINLIEKSTLDDAQKAAFEEAASTHKNPIQVLLFTQGERTCASGTLSIGRAIQMMKSDPVEVKKNEKANLDQVRNAYNRPINKDHVKSVRDYLCKNVNGKYILPSLTVNAVLPHKVFTTKSEGVRVGYLLVDFMSPHLTVTDGQHRLNGIRDAIAHLEETGCIDEANKLRDDGVSIMFSFEEDIDQVHQDFADCSKTKALPKSMIAVYDKRIPVNRLTMDFIDHCSLFNDGKIDTASTSLSAKSTSFALASNVRGLLKSLYTGQPSLADSAFDKMTNEHLSDESVYEDFSKRAFRYLNVLIQHNDTLLRISELPKGPERQEIPLLRKNFYIASPAGINLCGAFIFELMSNSSLSEEERVEYIKRLAVDIDWSKSADIWKGSVVTHGLNKNGDVKYAINSTNSAVKKALGNIQDALGYKKDDLLALM